ncbi:MULTISPECIES: hypothetical protein [unclassified Enterococcus]|uniref:hypothetical protein n=1 Tax=unclassified Enterococcus TaxID=2608891 RepID=UPI001CE110F2|nr:MULTISPECIES: hypothetical protein [unclassified Enterococcus]MCA5014572.1 hypothetical protein [Enterococcus sp. S23]MCA5017825.1 hypothetical protein [Enterococcus sp. S22(2020)]
MNKLQSFWTGKKKLESNHALTIEERDALLSVLAEAETVLVPSEREFEVYMEAKETLAHFDSRESQESLYSFFEPKVQQFENKYGKIIGVA